MSSNLAVEKIICVAHVYENGDGLLLEKAAHFYRLRVRVANYCVHHEVSRMRLFLCNFLFGFKALFSLGMTVEAMSKAIVGIAWMGGGDGDGSMGSRNVALIPNDRTS
ncbi:hypothetical protein GW17_00042585 [Ensete ventricosum]|nr:hypothetical protein GW17_00042585 [Ensete ventricosum]